MSAQPTTSTSTDVERVKAIVDSLVRKGVAYIVGLHAYLCNPFWPNIGDTLKPAFGETVAKDVSSEVYSAFKGIDIYAKVKVEGVEVELRDYLQRYILREHVSRMILEEVEKRFNQMLEGERRVLSAACAIINAVKGKDYPAFSMGESEGYLSVYSLDGEYFSKVVSSVFGFEVPNVRSLFYKYLLGFQCDGSSRRHVWYKLNIYPFVKTYIEKLASEAQRYIRIFNRHEVEEKLNELYRNGDLLRLSVIHEMMYSMPTWESLDFLSHFKGVRYEDLCKWAKVEGIINDCFVNPLVYDYVKNAMKTLHDRALSELVESFRKVFERAGYESICVNKCCTFTKALSKPVYTCFSPWPKEISVPYVPEGVRVAVIQGMPAQSILKYLQDRRREELWVFVEGDKIFIASNTYKAEDRQEVVRVLSNRFSVNFIGPPGPPGRKLEEPSGMPPRPLRRRAKDILEDVVAEVLESLGFTVRVDQRVQGRSGEIEVDVWGEKIIGDTRFIVYASCKNWDNPVDVKTVREEFGRILQMISIPNVWILVAPAFTDSARREAIANGFVVIEVGEKVHEGNVDRVYSKVYDKLDKLFTGVAPKRLQELAEKVRELAERAKRIAEEARRSAEEIEEIRRELERIATSTRPPELPAPPPPTPPKATGSVLDEMFDKLNVPGDLRARAKRLLLHVYTTCYDLYVDREDADVAYKLGRRETYRTGVVGWFYVVGDEDAYLVLRQLNLVDLIRDSRAKSLTVTLKNKDVVANVAREHVDSVREDLRKLIEEYGWEAALIAYVKGRAFRYESFEPELLEYEGLPGKVTIAIGAVKPLLKERYLKFWEELEKLGLAFWCRGVWTLLPEARKVVVEIIDDKLKEFSRREAVVKKLIVLNVLYNCFPIDDKKEHFFKSLINKLGLKLEDLAEVAEGLHKKGVVSTFTTTPPYMIVYDVNAFRKAIIEEIESLYNSQMRQP